jgi:hypothetical protein
MLCVQLCYLRDCLHQPLHTAWGQDAPDPISQVPVLKSLGPSRVHHSTSTARPRLLIYRHWYSPGSIICKYASSSQAAHTVGHIC